MWGAVPYVHITVIFPFLPPKPLFWCELPSFCVTSLRLSLYKTIPICKIFSLFLRDSLEGNTFFLIEMLRDKYSHTFFFKRIHQLIFLLLLLFNMLTENLIITLKGLFIYMCMLCVPMRLSQTWLAYRTEAEKKRQCGGLKELSPTSSYIWMLDFQLRDLSGRWGGVVLWEVICHGGENWGFERIRKITRARRRNKRGNIFVMVMCMHINHFIMHCISHT